RDEPGHPAPGRDLGPGQGKRVVGAEGGERSGGDPRPLGGGASPDPRSPRPRRRLHPLTVLLPRNLSGGGCDYGRNGARSSMSAGTAALTSTGPDAELVEAARAGDKPALAALVRRHRAMVITLCTRSLGDADTAEDA